VALAVTFASFSGRARAVTPSPPSPLTGDEPACVSGREASEEPVSLLQLGLAASSEALLASQKAAASPPSLPFERFPGARARLQKLKPLIWVHISKTGTGMLNTLYNHPGICPNATQEARASPVGVEDEWFYDHYPREEACPGSFNLSYSGRGHLGFGPYFRGNQGHAIAMFRQPEQRAISAYYWSKSQLFVHTPELKTATIREYAIAVQGCQTKMLAEDGYPEGPSPCVVSYIPPTDRMVQVSLQRLRHGFAFVGITDKWDLSLCLFHKMFGGDCTVSEFTNTRPGPASSSSYDIAVLDGWTDKFDRPVYELALTMFEEELRKYGVSHESCRAWCGRPAPVYASTRKA